MKLADMFVFGFRNFCRNGVMNFCRNGVMNFCRNGARKISLLVSLLVSGFWLFSSSNCLSFKHQACLLEHFSNNNTMQRPIKLLPRHRESIMKRARMQSIDFYLLWPPCALAPCFPLSEEVPSFEPMSNFFGNFSN